MGPALAEHFKQQQQKKANIAHAAAKFQYFTCRLIFSDHLSIFLYAILIAKGNIFAKEEKR